MVKIINQINFKFNFYIDYFVVRKQKFIRIYSNFLNIIIHCLYNNIYKLYINLDLLEKIEIKK